MIALLQFTLKSTRAKCATLNLGPSLLLAIFQTSAMKPWQTSMNRESSVSVPTLTPATFWLERLHPKAKPSLPLKKSFFEQYSVRKPKTSKIHHYDCPTANAAELLALRYSQKTKATSCRLAFTNR